MTVEFLFWRDCPSHDEALATLRSILRDHRPDVPVQVIEIESLADAELHAFPGSPTIRVDGADVDAGGASGPPSLTCRVYRLPDGRPSPVPSREQIEEALRMSLAAHVHAPDFTLPGVDGRDHALADYAAAEVLVLVQSCNHCPYVLAWEGRLNEVQRDYETRGVRVVALCSNDATTHPADSFEAMVEHAREAGYVIDYLHDEDQSLARALGSERTPEVFVFDAGRRLRYHGAVDDSRDDQAVSAHYLRDALDAVLDGREPAVAETEPVGCTVKWRAA